jgi:hypothetical protein
MIVELVFHYKFKIINLLHNMSKIIPLNVKKPQCNNSKSKMEELVNVVSEMSSILTLIQESLDQTSKKCQ